LLRNQEGKQKQRLKLTVVSWRISDLTFWNSV
jgi:hypothetical protein